MVSTNAQVGPVAASAASVSAPAAAMPLGASSNGMITLVYTANDTTADYGQNVTYTYTVTNNLSFTLSQNSVTDSARTSITRTSGDSTLSPGERETFTSTKSMTQTW